MTFSTVRSKCVRITYLDPITIGIKHKGYVLHATIRQLLLPIDLLLLEASTGGIQVIYGNANVAKAELCKHIYVLISKAILTPAAHRYRYGI